MQASTYGSIRENLVFGVKVQQQRRVLGFGDFRRTSLCMTDKATVLTSAMGAKLARPGIGFDGISMNSLKPRSLRAQASAADGDMENLVPPTPQVKSSGTVLPYVGVACLGAILFGYHLGVVNGSLEYLSKDLGIAENVALKGWVVSTLLAGATVGSFTGGALADKFGRTRTFQLDAIPLMIGAFLCATAQSVEQMIIGRVLAGIGIGISSAIVPLYISEISPTEIRGALGSVNQLFICLGILGALVAGLPLSATTLTTVSYSFLVNGEVCGLVRPKRGIRQGDHLSPYLFILCAEGLSSLIQHLATSWGIQGMKLSSEAPLLHHLLFADDSFLFGTATEEECQQDRNILYTYKLLRDKE